MSFQVISTISKSATADLMDSIELKLRKFQLQCEKAGLQNDKLYHEERRQGSFDASTNRANSSNNKTFAMPTESEMWDAANGTGKDRGKPSFIFFQSERHRAVNEFDRSGKTSDSKSAVDL